MPLAIVGMACRFAGDVTSPDKLWELVSNGRDAWSDVPAERFNRQSFYHPKPENLSTMHMKGGFFLGQDPGVFDCSFFNLSADVAAAMDPQIRLLLEVTFEALESAGIPLPKLRDPLHALRGFLTGNYAAMLANRVSHFFDLKGPSTAVDVGCSTSLMALHLAAQSLRSGDSDCAIVGGTSLHLNPDVFAGLSTLQTCGAEGKCYAFDHRAEGYGRGDGIAALIVKRLSDALRDGDPIRAVVRETAVNQDGRTPTITAPCAEAQRRLISQCYRTAGLDPLKTSVVEAHGTGTRVGDPAEARAIGEALGRHRPPELPPLYVASVKTNLGHTEAASGLAAIIKMVLALEHCQIPPSLNFERPNPDIDMQALRIKVPTTLEPWEPRSVRRVSINNFGYGGTNTHVIMEEAGHLVPPTPHQNRTTATNNSASKLFLLSARDKATVAKMAVNLREHLAQHPELGNPESFADLAYTLCERRSRFSWTWSATATNATELAAALADTTIQPAQNNGTAPRLGFVFNGQGAQWFAMGRELSTAYPVYAQTLAECDDAIRSFGASWSLVEELHRDEKSSRVNQVQMSMPLSCAVQVALVQLLRFLDISPAAVTGHSSGEVAAAFAAGALSLREAMACTYFRGLINAQHLAGKDARPGSMMAVGVGAADAQPYLDGVTAGKAVVVCVNSPSSVTLSGDLSAMDELEARFTSQNVFARKLRVQAAFHSHHMLLLEDHYRAALRQHMDTNKPRTFTPGLLFLSPVTGKRVDDANTLGPEHWVQNMTQPVLFAQSFHNMVAPDAQTQQVDVVVEVGPHSALAGPIRQSLTGVSALKKLAVRYASCLERGADAVRTVQTLAGFLVARAYPVSTARANSPGGAKQTKPKALGSLPSYPWNHTQRYWHEPRMSANHRFRPFPAHDLLGSRLPGTSDYAPIWRHILRAGELPWVHDHVVQGATVYPAAGFVAMAVEAMRQLHTDDADRVSGYLLREVEFLKALVISESERGVEVQLFLEPANEKTLAFGKRVFRIYSAPVGTEGTCIRVSASHPRSMNPSTLYDALQAVGVHHGSSFQKLVDIRRSEGESAATFEVCDSAALMPPLIPHYRPRRARRWGGAVPTSIKALYISSAFNSRPGHHFHAHSRLLHHHRQGFDISLAVTGDGDRPRPLIEADTMRFTTVGGPEGVEDAADTALSKICAFIDWTPSVALNDPVSQFAARLKRPADPSEKAIGRDLVRAAYHLVADATAQLTPADIAGFEWYHQRLWTWMQLQLELAAADKVAPKSSRWAKATPGAKAMFLDRVAAANTNGALVVRVGRNLIGIMRQQLAPLEIMLEGGLLYRFYSEMLHFTASTAQLAEVATALAAEIPQLRILEIGAGTGGCTGPVLAALAAQNKGGVNAAPFARYDFTDISSGFFQAARERFADWGDLIHYTALNIEQDVVDQGFVEHSYDVIIAAQVLHATKSMAVTMRNVRRLLKDGGKLMLVETTRDTPDFHLIFGTLPGWWLSEEPERKLSPNMSLETWEPILKGAGFSGLDLNVWDCEDEEHKMMSVIMSTAIPESPPVYESQVALVCDPSTPPPSEWLRGLAVSIAEATGAHPTLTDLANLDIMDKVCVFLSGLDAAQKIDASNFPAVKTLVTASKGLLWVTTGSTIDCPTPENAMHTGFLRTCRVEYGSRPLVSLDLDPARAPWDVGTQTIIAKVLAASFDYAETNELGAHEFEFAERDGVIMLPRVRRDAAESAAYANTPGEAEMKPFIQQGPDDRQLKLEVLKPGLLDSIVFRDDEDANQPLADGWVEVEPRAYGINFRDVMGAMGQLDEKQELGIESAGVVTRVGAGAEARGLHVGARVVALTVHGHITSRVRAPWTSVVAMPNDMSFTEGASVGMVFVTAYYALFEAARLEPGESVLIHAASGGVGQACIILAQWQGLDIYVTVGTPEKRAFLSETYGIPDERIFNSRDASFAPAVMAATQQRGVDAVINSLSGALLHESWGVLAVHGRFVEIGKKDIHRNMALDMGTFRRAASFIAVDVAQLCDFRGPVVYRVLKAVMELLRTKAIRNISPIVTYPMAEIGRALRTMQAGKHIGKIVVVPEKEDLVKTLPRRDSAILSPNASYLIVGGLSGIGRSIARWAVDRGTKHLILLSRSTATSPHSQALRDELTALGANVATRNCDASDMASLKAVLADCARTMPPVRGVIHGGMVLDDSILERMTPAQWQAALSPKVAATLNLEALFPSLDFYILLSSATGVIGSASQSNYAAGGAFQDAVARRRAAARLPCVAIDLGMVAGIGFVAESDAALANRLLESGHRPLSESEVLQLVDYAVRHPLRIPRTSQVVAGLAGSAIRRHGAGWTRERRFAALCDDDSVRGAVAATKSVGSAGLKEHLAAARSADEAGGVVERAVVGKLANMFVIPEEDIDATQPLSKYGVDSLVAVELRNWLVPMTQCEMSIFDLLGAASLKELANEIVGRSKLVYLTE
ncbi:Polyketide synthase (Fragment) [Madurella fahalii]|uniref:Polyketide synthase n=1 Tax=Madurella fahalii TaxID=1157608 RepID=A0ABQ0GKD1_9PEZI